MNRIEFIKNALSAMAGMLVLPLVPKAKATGNSIVLYEDYIAGYKFYRGKKIEHELNKGTILNLQCEPENPEDENAIAIYYKNVKLGFIKRDHNLVLKNMLVGNKQLQVKIKEINLKEESWKKVLIEVTMT